MFKSCTVTLSLLKRTYMIHLKIHDTLSGEDKLLPCLTIVTANNTFFSYLTTVIELHKCTEKHQIKLIVNNYKDEIIYIVLIVLSWVCGHKLCIFDLYTWYTEKQNHTLTGRYKVHLYMYKCMVVRALFQKSLRHLQVLSMFIRMDWTEI